VLRASEALSVILDAVKPCGTITCSLLRANGSVLAHDIVADENVPTFDNSAMDGFAIRTEDIHQTPVSLRIIGEIPAGSVAAQQLHQGEAMSIMTGAKIPQGADAIVQQEWTERVDEHTIKILHSVSFGHNVRRAGADITNGTVVLRSGTLLRPQEIGVLASLGERFVEVFRMPRVAILTTGSEIVDIDKPVPEGKIRNSNYYTLRTLLEELRCEVMPLGIAQDNRTELKEKISQGLQEADMLITSGGVSVGKYDFVKDVFKELAIDIQFSKVNIKPGMPLVFGMHGKTPVFGLPGNPVSSMVTFMQFVKPALRKMMGWQEPDIAITLRAQCEEDLVKTDGKRHFIRGIIECKNGSLNVRTTGSQVSNKMTSLVAGNCLIIIPEEKEHVHKGDEVEVQLL
jgi:molybdopterin molybdotransferase